MAPIPATDLPQDEEPVSNLDWHIALPISLLVVAVVFALVMFMVMWTKNGSLERKTRRLQLALRRFQVRANYQLSLELLQQQPFQPQELELQHLHGQNGNLESTGWQQEARRTSPGRSPSQPGGSHAAPDEKSHGTSPGGGEWPLLPVPTPSANPTHVPNRPELSRIHHTRPDTIPEASTAGELTLPALPSAAVHAGAGLGGSEDGTISQNFSHPSLVPRPLSVSGKKQQAGEEPSSPTSAGGGKAKLRRTHSSPMPKKEHAQSARVVTDPECVSSAAVAKSKGEEELEFLPATVYVPPKIPPKSHRRSSQGAKLASSRPLIAKPLPQIPRSDRDTLPSQSRSFLTRSPCYGSDLDKMCSNAPAAERRPLFPATCRDSSQALMPASYASSQCLPTVGSSATIKSTGSEFGDSAGSGRRPRRGNALQDSVHGDLNALRAQHQSRRELREQQHRLSGFSAPIVEEDESAVRDSDSDAESTTAQAASPERK